MITKEEYKILEMKQKEYIDICEHLGTDPGSIESLAIVLLATQGKNNNVTTNIQTSSKPKDKKDFTPFSKNEDITPSRLNEIKHHMETNPDIEEMVKKYLEYVGKDLENLKQGQGSYLLKQIKERE